MNASTGGLLILSQRRFEGKEWLNAGCTVAALRHEWYAAMTNEEKKNLLWAGRWAYCILELAEEPRDELGERLAAAWDLVVRLSGTNTECILMRSLAVQDNGLAYKILGEEGVVIGFQNEAYTDLYQVVYDRLLELDGARFHDPMRFMEFLDDLMQHHEDLADNQNDRDGAPPSWVVYLRGRGESFLGQPVFNTLSQPIVLCAIEGNVEVGPGVRHVPSQEHDCQYYAPPDTARKPLLYDAVEDCYSPMIPRLQSQTVTPPGDPPKVTAGVAKDAVKEIAKEGPKTAADPSTHCRCIINSAYDRTVMIWFGNACWTVVPYTPKELWLHVPFSMRPRVSVADERCEEMKEVVEGFCWIGLDGKVVLIIA